MPKKILYPVFAVTFLGAVACAPSKHGGTSNALLTPAVAKPAANPASVVTRVGSLNSSSSPAPATASVGPLAGQPCPDPTVAPATGHAAKFSDFSKGTWQLVSISLYSKNASSGESYTVEALPGDAFHPRVMCNDLKQVADGSSSAEQASVNAAESFDLVNLKSSANVISSSVNFKNGRLDSSSANKITILPADLKAMPDDLQVQGTGACQTATAQMQMNSKGQMEIRAQATVAADTSTINQSFLLVYQLEH